jgi:AcrR family transcriptional regulator
MRNRGVSVDAELREATIAVLREGGWDGLTLERVAEVAGRARSTLWRQQITRESLIAALLSDLAEDYRKAMYPVLTASGSGRDRLRLAMNALCDVIDEHLPLLLATDEAFHQKTVPGHPPSYLSPFIQFLREGAADGSLVIRENVVDQADVAWNAVAWTYTHLRGRHGWDADHARRLILDLLLSGLGGEAKE